MREENQDQTHIITYSRGKYPKVRIIVCPIVYYGDDPKRRAIIGRQIKAMGYDPGTPDMMFAAARAGYHGLFIELKKAKGGRKEKEQNEMMVDLTMQGYCCYFVHGYDAAIKTLDAYMEGNPL